MFSALLQVGCGKKVTNRETDENTDDRRNVISEFYKLKSSLTTSGTSIADFNESEADHEVRIPASINVEEGNAGNKTAVIYFNAKSETNFSFYCRYTGGAPVESPIIDQDIEKGLAYNFDGCFTQVNDQSPINYYPGYELTHYKDNKVILELLSADPRFNAKANAEFEVIWH